jgi:hypothetical protein
VLNAKGSGSTPSLKTHCRREVFQAALRLIFGEEFVHAYQNGIILIFPDGVKRKCFIRIITYSADYPEK